MKKTIFNCIAIVFLIITTYSHTQSYYQFDLNVTGGLGAIHIDNNNNKWIATQNKVYFYSGTNFTDTIHYDTSDGLINNTVRVIKGDAQGNIWFGTSDGVSKFDGINWTNYTTNDGLLSNSISAITFDVQGNVWFGTSDGVSKFDGINWTNYTTSNAIGDLCIDMLGNIWVAAGGAGVSKFDGTTWINMQSGDDSFNIESDSQGNIWSAGYELKKYDGFNWVTLANAGLYTLRGLEIDVNDKVYVGTCGTGSVSGFNGGGSFNTSLGSNIASCVRDIETDLAGNIWVIGQNESARPEMYILCSSPVELPLLSPSAPNNLYQICSNSSVVLNATGANSYVWYRDIGSFDYNDSILSYSQNININSNFFGLSNLKLFSLDINGCKSNPINFSVTSIIPPTPEICLITNQSGKNMIVWQENTLDKAISYRIYKQNNTTSLYDIIHEQDIDSLSEYLDESTNLSTISRYKLGLVDSCGLESSLSSNHTTILLTSSLGTNDNVNLNWNAYEGFTYPNFEIWRSIDGIDYNLLATVANTTFSYIDNNPNNNSYYQIRVVPLAPCTSTRGTYGNVASNIVDKNGNSISNVLENNLPKYAIHPNPTSSSFTIKVTSFTNKKIKLFNPSGQLVLEKTLDSEKSIVDVSGLSKGIYFVDFGNSMEKLIIE